MLALACFAVLSHAVVPQAFDAGATIRIYEVGIPMRELPELVPGQTPNVDRKIDRIDLSGDGFFGYQDRFYAVVTADLMVPQDGNYRFRLSCDDGAALRLDGKVVIDHDGIHPASPKEASVRLTAGAHPLNLVYFEETGEQRLTLEWQPEGASDWRVLDASALRTPAGITRVVAPGPKRIRQAGGTARPGNGMPLDRLHPGWDLIEIRPKDFKPQVGSMAFRADGKLLVGTFEPNQSGVFDPNIHDGKVWLMDGVTGTDRGKVTYKLVAQDLQEPLGMAVIGKDVYVSTRTAILRLVDDNGDDVFDRKEVVGSGWPADNYHHFCFGLAEKDGWLYAALSTSITGDAPGINGPNPRFRGSLFRVDPKRYDPKLPLANIEFLDSGHRTPNGVSAGPNGLILVGENQGSWQPSNKVNVLQLGGFYGHVNSTTFKNQEYPNGGVPGLFDDKPFTPPAIYLPQNDIANSPAQMVTIPSGEFKGQILISDVKYGGLRRGWLEQVDGVWQGGAVQYSQGFEVGTNRLIWGPDGALYLGGIGATETWAWTDPKTGQWTKFGLQKIRRNKKQAFEIESVKATADGFAIQFNQAVDPAQVKDAKRYFVRQWHYTPTVDYGGPKVDQETLEIKSLDVKPGNREVVLHVPSATAGRVVYFNLDLRSAKKEPLWATEAWYTLNRKPRSLAAASALAVDHPRLLVFSRTTGFRHDSIPAGIQALREIAQVRGWTIDATEDPAKFTDAQLANYDAVVFLCTTGDVLNPEQQAAFERFIRSGKGFVGVHAATDTEYDWPWYNRLVGAQFDSHPEIQAADVKIVDAAHPSTAKLPRTWSRVDEWYNFKFLAPDLRILAKLDESSYKGGKMGAEHPLVWCHEFDGGRAWYTEMGHTDSAYSELLFRDHLTEGILWAANAGKAAKATSPTWDTGGAWVLRDGVYKNDPITKPLLSKEEYGDQKVHVEFRIPKGGNSGVYLQGRYEVQILDSYGKPNRELETSDCGAIYHRWKDETPYEGSAPARNAARPAGEWNTLDILFRAPRFQNGKKVEDATFIEVRLNGVVVQTFASTTGPTRAAMFEDEKPLGPLMIQGDHGPTEIRNVWVEPIQLH